MKVLLVGGVAAGRVVDVPTPLPLYLEVPSKKLSLAQSAAQWTVSEAEIPPISQFPFLVELYRWETIPGPVPKVTFYVINGMTIQDAIEEALRGYKRYVRLLKEGPQVISSWGRFVHFVEHREPAPVVIKEIPEEW